VFSLIAAEKTNYPVAVMCRVFGVNRTGLHNWERRAPSDRALSDAWLTDRIKQIHDQSRGVYYDSRRSVVENNRSNNNNQTTNPVSSTPGQVQSTG
jgi:hypothetical protein